MPKEIKYTDLLNEPSLEEVLKYLLNCPDHELILFSNIADSLIEERDL